MQVCGYHSDLCQQVYDFYILVHTSKHQNFVVEKLNLCQCHHRHDCAMYACTASQKIDSW